MPGKSSIREFTLGVELDGQCLCTKVTHKRFWRVRRALEHVESHRRISGDMLRVLLGHCTFTQVYMHAHGHMLYTPTVYPQKSRKCTAHPRLHTLLYT